MGLLLGWQTPRGCADALGSAEDFPFLAAPARRALNDGYRTLVELGAIDDEHRITERGQLLTAALFAARDANVKQLLAKAS